MKAPSGLALGLFLCYSLAYALFVGVVLFQPAALGIRVGPINLAVLTGVGLIAMAIVFASLYTGYAVSEEEP